ncbi:RIP metalloprotease RseP [Microaerobacter geothermalis]|uniref:RIP metalloprotease RseP n=1 Tax=Microaerobacter geothermalis TaxID=674972 RepID=UPI001F2AAF72|nr:RIP metalloprotease RseP [Microaerobacter geothermalis]MCF6093800.1 RIP metalloprotease RseP [Microaerobacter geothermalis]
MVLQTVIAIILVFGALIFFHELGHFLLAKRAGILCREFAIGFGPKIISFKKGETRYTLRIFPLGGFVRMAGEDPEVVEIKPGQQIGVQFNNKGEVVKIIASKNRNASQWITVRSIDLTNDLRISGENEQGVVSYQVHPEAHIYYDDQEVQIAPYDRQFSSKTIWQRFLTIFAGPAMNFVLAILLFMIVGLLNGVPSDKPFLGEVDEGGPAAIAGLQKGDRVISVNSVPVRSWSDFVEDVRRNPNKEITLIIERKGEQFRAIVKTSEIDGVGKVGVYQPTEFSIVGSAIYGVSTTYEFTSKIFEGLGMMIKREVSTAELSGPVGIFKYTGEMAQKGLTTLLIWAAFLSINLGIFNLLPIPALDGGRLIFLAIELVRGKPIDPHKESMVHFLGFALLMLLILVVTWNDIQKFFL